MQIRGMSFALVFSLSLPMITDIAVQTQAVANLPFPEGEFFNGQGQSHS